MTIRETDASAGRFGDADTRRLVVMVPLPDRRTDPKTGATLPLSVRRAFLRDDIVDAMAKASRKLADQASRHHNRGFTEDLDDIQFNVESIEHGILNKYVRPTLVATLVIRRQR